MPNQVYICSECNAMYGSEVEAKKCERAHIFWKRFTLGVSMLEHQHEDEMDAIDNLRTILDEYQEYLKEMDAEPVKEQDKPKRKRGRPRKG